ncbi:VanZ family protein [Sulfitobacter aestuarii]|uniref:VanZ family protein n=1 Tax=Sulfitobacter aestuarii TaxID=2161676 RepID=A0ABW5U1U4_9RHOB
MSLDYPNTASRRRRYAAFALTGSLAAVIGYLTLIPSDLSQGVPGSDKLYHFLAFAALTLPCAALYPRALLMILPGALLYGGVIELIQPSVGRSAEWMDFLADMLGTSVGAALGLIINQLLPRSFSRAEQRIQS